MSTAARKKIIPTLRADRLEARVTPEAKALLQQAAAMQGRTLTDFVVHSALESAKITLRENQLLELTYRDRLAFVEALIQSPTKPNAKLQEAAARYQTISRANHHYRSSTAIHRH